MLAGTGSFKYGSTGIAAKFYRKEREWRNRDTVSAGWSVSGEGSGGRRWNHSRIRSYAAAAPGSGTRLDPNRLSSGAIEGMDNEIKSISHLSFRFYGAENFIAAIYHYRA